MKKFLLTLAAVAFASSALLAQTPATPATQEEPDRIQMRHLSKNPTGLDTPTGYDKPQVKKETRKVLKEEKPVMKNGAKECKDHKAGQPCTKPADQQCPDCKAKAAAEMKDCCKDKKMEGKKCEKAEGMKHECKDHKDGKCDKPADQQCPDCKAKAAAKKN